MKNRTTYTFYIRQNGFWEGEDILLRCHFGYIDDQPSHIHPCTSTDSLEPMLMQSAVSGFVISGVEAVLGHIGLDVVASMLLFNGETFYFLPEQRCGKVFLFKISERLGSPISLAKSYSPSSASLWGRVYILPDVNGSCSCVGYLNVPAIGNWPENKSCTSLHPTGLYLHGFSLCVGVRFRKRSVFRTLICSVSIEVFDCLTSHTLSLINGLLDIVAVRGACTCNLYGGDNAGLVVFNGLGDVGTVALNLLVSFVAVMCIRIIGILDAVTFNLLFVAKCNNSGFHTVLLIKHPVEQRISRSCILQPFENGIDDSTQRGYLLRQCGRIGRIDGVIAFLAHQGFRLLAERRIQPMHVAFVGKGFLQCPKHNLVSAVLRDIAADEFAVHADRLTGYVEFLNLLPCDMLETLLHKIDTGLIRIITQTAVKEIICVKRRGGRPQDSTDPEPCVQASQTQSSQTDSRRYTRILP